MYVHVPGFTDVQMYMCLCPLWIQMSVPVFVYLCMHVCMHICLCLFVCMLMCLCLGVYIHLCLCVCVCMFVYINEISKTCYQEQILSSFCWTDRVVK